MSDEVFIGGCDYFVTDGDAVEDGFGVIREDVGGYP